MCGHLDFSHSKHINTHNFFESFGNEYNMDKTFELEADSKAAILTLARLANNCAYIDNSLFGSITKDALGSKKTWEVSVYTILSLFDYFENIHNNTSNTHPKPSYRAFASIMFIAGEIADKPSIRGQLPFISNNKDAIYNYFTGLVVFFYSKYKSFSPDQIFKTQQEASEYCSKIGSIISKSKVNNYSLIQGKWT